MSHSEDIRKLCRRIVLERQAYKVPHCTGRILANTRPHQLHWSDCDAGDCYLMQRGASLIHIVG